VIVNPDEIFRKAWGCLAGLAIGDAMGMPVEWLTADEIHRRYGRVTTFHAPHASHPHAALRGATVTDDTEHALLIAQVLIAQGAVTAQAVADALVRWERERNGLSLSTLGPSTREALRRLLEGVDPITAGAYGRTIGAAMRAAPIGVAHPGDRAGAIREAVLASLPTHGTNVAIAGATAVAAAVAEAMLPAATIGSIIAAAIDGAEQGAQQGTLVAGATVARRIKMACELGQGTPLEEAAPRLAEYIGVDMLPTEGLPTALGLLAASEGAPMRAVIAAVNLGGDADTVAAIAGAIGGAHRGIEAFPPELLDELEAVNHLNLRGVARALAERALQSTKPAAR